MSVIEDITNGHQTDKRAAMYYKTEPFYSNVDNYTHTNNWEILCSIKILNSKGYAVDLIDRTCTNWEPKHEYDMFLGLGVGNSGRHFARYSELSKAKKRILLAMGPQPDTSNALNIKRYEEFKERTGHSAPPMRTVQDVVGDKFLEIIDNTDYIFCIGEKGTNAYNSFLGYDRSVINFMPSISPKIQFSEQWLNTRQKDTFLCFAGNGFICKGVDLVVEAFLKDPTKKLYICGPQSEASFFNYYGNKINQSSNIQYLGFIEPGAETFNKLVSVCSYTIFHASSEGCCTSVATTMKAGLVPIINRWTGINITNEGITMSDDGNKIENIEKAIANASCVSDQEYAIMVQNVLRKSQAFSQQSFFETYSKAIDLVINA